jgi:hypothetical protein
MLGIEPGEPEGVAACWDPAAPEQAGSIMSSTTAIATGQDTPPMLHPTVSP